MRKVVVKKKSFYIGEKEYPLTDLYTEGLYKYSNQKATEYVNDLFCVNESFSSLTQVYLCIEFFFKEHNVDFVDFTHADDNIILYISDIVKKHNIPSKGSAFKSIVKKVIVSYSNIIASGLYLSYLMARIPKAEKNINVTKKFAVLRQKSAIQKFKGFTEISKEYEDPYSKTSVYKYFGRLERICWSLSSLYEAFGYLGKIHKFYGAKLGQSSPYAFNTHYQKRIVHGLLYQHLMEAYLPNFKGCTYYTGSNLDRYSVIEWDIAKKHGIRTICIPHGLEYGYRFPKGFSADVFYANSEFAANYLNKLYNTKKYVYDNDIVTRMFKLPEGAPHERKVVFFTEQQEFYVNQEILSTLTPKLRDKGIEIYVKLHPGDAKSHYEGCNYKYITDYYQSLTHNIVVSRKSTVLLEALYNDSTAIAIITTQKDKAVFETFPSLSSDRIIKTYDIESLYQEIVKVFK